MKPSDVELSRLAVAWGWLDQTDFRRCLREADRCQAMGLDKGIDEIFLEEQRLSREQLQKLRRHLGWSLERSRIGGFEILRRIGVGGSGSVFEARHVRLNQRVALKVLYPRFARDRRMTGLFLREARALARLNHPHLVHAYDGGRDGRYYYLAMEYVEGENLLQCLTREGPLSVERSLEIVKAVCEALTALEARRLVHRDIKPANILLTADGGVKLADLGLLKVETGADAPAEWVCGTPHYLSPEQARGDGTEDTRSDLYSLGATWYHALAGRPPFVGASSREILLAHGTREPPPLRKLRDDVPQAIERAVHGWLSKDPALRPATSRQAIEELERLERPKRGAPAHGSQARWVPIAVSLAAACGLALWLSLWGGLPPESSVPVGTPASREAARGTAISLPAQPPPEGGTTADSEATASAESVEAVTPAAESSSRPDRTAADVTTTARVVTTPSEGGSRLLGSVGRELGMLAAGLGEAWSDGWRRVQHLSAAGRERFDALQPLARAFHAHRSALAPVGETGLAVLLDYEFASRAELDDFRARPGSARLEDGDLVAAGGPFGTTLESVGWFAPPLRIEGEVSPGTLLTLGFGELRISPWDRASHGDRSGGTVPSESARPVFELRLDHQVLRLRAGDRIHVEQAAVPVRGRVALGLESGRLRWLRIESRVEMTWAMERLRVLEELAGDR